MVVVMLCVIKEVACIHTYIHIHTVALYVMDRSGGVVSDGGGVVCDEGGSTECDGW